MNDDVQKYEKMWEECCREESLRCSTEYWNSRAEDYTDFITHSDFDHGRKILALFQHEELISPESQVLDIGSGPGAITIPFAEKVQSVTSVEPAGEMINNLLKNARDKNLSNISTIPQIWQDVSTDDLKKQFDLTICCHSIWHFPDIFTQISRMEQVSRGWCALAHGISPGKSDNDISQKLGIPFDETDRFILVKQILENRGIFPNVSILPITMRRTVESGRSMLTLGLKKYREPQPADIALIDEHLAANSRDGMYEKTGTMGVLWWRVA
ncbi:MAG TPA: class I SAM-dependent methyltransferase [Methanospirillum sp.]|nr:class I SAM-dependent methyltransferase [Methanospirillum sp.]